LVGEIDDRELVGRVLSHDGEHRADRGIVVEIGALVQREPVVDAFGRLASTDEGDFRAVVQRTKVYRDGLLVAAVDAEARNENTEERKASRNESPHIHLEALGADGVSIIAIITP
jgi:hypothetical protein